MNKIAIRKESQNFRYEIEAPLQKLMRLKYLKKKQLQHIKNKSSPNYKLKITVKKT